MATNDSTETLRKLKSIKRKVANIHQELEVKKLFEETIITETLSSSSNTSSSTNDSLDKNKPNITTRNRSFQITNTAAASIRFGVSQRATAELISGVIEDLIENDYLTNEDKNYLICDSSKVARAKENLMNSCKAAVEKNILENELQGIFLDGRKDKTKVLTRNEETGKYHPDVISEEHYTMTQEPEGKYIHHFTPTNYFNYSKPEKENKPAKRTARGAFDWINSHDAKDSLVVIGGDSTNTITGSENGVLTSLEKLLGHKCCWIICMIHTNELPLKHLIRNLDGDTCSAEKFSGTIGKLLSNVNNISVNYNFKAISDGEDLIDLPETTIKSLSTDQHNCYRLVKAIKCGQLSKDVANLKCGPIHHARWLTTGQALLMLWTRDHNFQGETLRTFELIVRYVIQSYFKLYFDIKVKNKLVDGPKHILTTIRIYRTQPKEVQKPIKDVIERGAYNAHSENLLLSLLASEVENERVFAVDKILKLRGPFEYGNKCIRDRVTPQLNFKATSLSNLILWDKNTCYEPIFTCNMNKNTIKSFKNNPMSVPNFAIHTQSTERAVQLVSKASMAVFGQEKRDGYVKGMLSHRELFPVINSKKTLI